jgi:hypothetical protein
MKFNPDNFRELIDEKIKVDLAKQASPLEKGLLILTLAQDKLGHEYLSADEIVIILEKLGIAISKSGLIHSFNRAGVEKINTKKHGEILEYKAMIMGKEYVKGRFTTIGPNVLYIEGGKPFSTRKKLDEIFQELKGDICICDKYFGERSFDIISKLPKGSKLKFLTSILSDSLLKIKSIQIDFQKEYPKSEFRVYPNKDLHDRYIVTTNTLLIIGHGIKDIGNKESFIIIIDSSIGQDTINTMNTVFNNKWNLSNPL